jgi:hypothetical protein
MKVQLTIATDTGRKTEVVEAESSFGAVEQLCADPRRSAELSGKPFANLVIMASPHDPLPGMTPAGRRTQDMLKTGRTQAEVAEAMQR